ncbi:uncharacterized protein LOC112690378 [Sipha flava]|uniref:DNA-directed DNA polymerase n=1 Tax=Sipha flava TaxID=143950 RepID=A0A8B8GBR5_9HEMI|nr:uncharacterized protein LOC112690378 [Sipha flava]
MSYGFIVKVSENVLPELLEQYNIPTAPVIFRGNQNYQSVSKHFIENIVKVAEKIEKLLKLNMPIIMTEEQHQSHNISTSCNLCKNKFSNMNHKVADHCHLSSEFRQTLCNTCNLKLQVPNFIPCFLHNLSNYDAHFIVIELGYDANKITVIPNSEEKFISFSKYISNKFSIRFIDTFRFMATSLSKLATNLLTPRLEKFRETAKHFTNEDMPLVTRKGVYPYEYTYNWQKLEDITLPSEAHFYSTLKEKHIVDEEYKHALTVWDHFDCKTLGEYNDLYLKIDILLLADVFQNFRDICNSTYGLDPAFYFTAPGFSFDCMLKHTGVKLKLLYIDIIFPFRIIKLIKFFSFTCSKFKNFVF